MSHIDNQEFRKIMINELLDNKDYAKDVIPYIKSEYFSTIEEASIWKVFNAYYESYNKIPNRSIIKVGLEKTAQLSYEQREEAKTILDFNNSNTKDTEWLKDRTEEWCKLRASFNAVIQSMQIIDGVDKSKTLEAMPSLLAEAVAVNFDRKIGTDYIESPEERWELYHTKLKTVPTGLDYLDEAMGGGYPSKSLIIFMAPTGVGKSLTMCNSAAYAVKTGYNALYLTMEMAEEKIAQRIDTNIFETPVKELLKLSKDEYVTKFESLKNKEHGKLIIKEYGTGTPTIINFSALLQELETKQNFKPAVIFVDYLNICASSRAGKGVNSYERVKYIAEELRSLAMLYDIPVVSATQANRDGIGASDLDLTNTSESIGLPQTADALFAMTATDEMREAGQMKFIKLKNRFGDPNYNKTNIVKVEYSIMKLTDINQPAHIEAINQIDKEDSIALSEKNSLSNIMNNKNEIDWS